MQGVTLKENDGGIRHVSERARVAANYSTN